MNLSRKDEFVFTVTSNELRLICKALGGRLKPDDIESAKQLDRDIAQAKIQIVENNYHEIQKLKSNLLGDSTRLTLRQSSEEQL